MPLDRTQTQNLKAALAARRAALLDELRQDADNVRAEPFLALAGDSRDASVAGTIIDTRRAELVRDLAELNAVDLALASGRYGFCTGCGEEISFERLCANPSAVRCKDCQDRHEKKRPAPASL